MDVQPNASTSLWTNHLNIFKWLVRNYKRAIYLVLGERSVNEDVLSTMIFIVEQTLNMGLLTPVSSVVYDLEALNPITSCLATNFFFTLFTIVSRISIIDNSSDKLKPMQI